MICLTSIGRKKSLTTACLATENLIVVVNRGLPSLVHMASMGRYKKRQRLFYKNMIEEAQSLYHRIWDIGIPPKGARLGPHCGDYHLTFLYHILYGRWCQSVQLESPMFSNSVCIQNKKFGDSPLTSFYL